MVDDKTRERAIAKIAEALDLHFGQKPTAHHRLARGIWDEAFEIVKALRDARLSLHHST